MRWPKSCGPERLDRLAWVLGTWAGVGALPGMPGTWGSLAALPLWWLSGVGGWLLWGLLVVPAVWSAGRLANQSGQLDPSWVVIDEVLGVGLPVLVVPHQPLAWLVAFVLFRLFDIWKPWPVCWAESVFPGGWGIVLDDVVAGVLAALFCNVLG